MNKPKLFCQYLRKIASNKNFFPEIFCLFIFSLLHCKSQKDKVLPTGFSRFLLFYNTKKCKKGAGQKKQNTAIQEFEIEKQKKKKTAEKIFSGKISLKKKNTVNKNFKNFLEMNFVKNKRK